MSRRRLLWTRVIPVCALVLLLVDVLGSGESVGRSVAGLFYGGVAAAVSLVFLLRRRRTVLVLFLYAVLAGAWIALAVSEITSAAEGIAMRVAGW
jgi:hypothetical protein